MTMDTLRPTYQARGNVREGVGKNMIDVDTR